MRYVSPRFVTLAINNTSFSIPLRSARGFFCSSTSARYFLPAPLPGLYRACTGLYGHVGTWKRRSALWGACSLPLRPACASRRHWEYFRAEKLPPPFTSASVPTGTGGGSLFQLCGNLVQKGAPLFIIGFFRRIAISRFIKSIH